MEPDSYSYSGLRTKSGTRSMASANISRSESVKQKNKNRIDPNESPLNDMKSLYDVIIDKKRMEGNPNEPFINRLVATGELMDPFQRPEARSKVGALFEKSGREFNIALRLRGEDPLTGFMFIYPTQVLYVLETNMDMIRKIILKWKERETSPDRIIVQHNILNIAVDVTRKMKSFQTKTLNQPMPLPNWLPPGGLSPSAAETQLNRIIRQIEGAISYISTNAKDKKVMDKLVEQKPEVVPDQDPLLFVTRSGILLTTEKYVERYCTPFNVSLVSEQSWPTNWPGKRLPCSVTFSEEESDEVWGVDLSDMRQSVGRFNSVVSRVNAAISKTVTASTNARTNSKWSYASAAPQKIQAIFE